MLFANRESTSIGRITSGTVALVVVTCFLSCFCFEARLVFSGHPPLGHDVLLCVLSPRVKFAFFFSAGSLLGTFQAVFSVFLHALGQLFGLREACCAPFLHRGLTKAHI